MSYRCLTDSIASQHNYREGGHAASVIMSIILLVVIMIAGTAVLSNLDVCGWQAIEHADACESKIDIGPERHLQTSPYR
jgi:hypothetical protein